MRKFGGKGQEREIPRPQPASQPAVKNSNSNNWKRIFPKNPFTLNVDDNCQTGSESTGEQLKKNGERESIKARN